MAKHELYCQNSNCGREIAVDNKSRGAVVADGRAYCSFEHAGIPKNADNYLLKKGVERAIKQGVLKEFGQLERKTD